MTFLRSPARTLACLLPLASLAAQRTWIVDQSGAGQFLEIQPAVEAAAPNDRIEVRGSFAYAGFLLTKGLDVEAVGASTLAWFTVRSLPGSERARLTGLHVVGGNGAPTSGALVRVETCSGVVDLEALRVDAPPGLSAVQLSLNATVLLRGATLVAGPTPVGQFAGATAVLSGSSNVTIEGSTLTGGRGRDGSAPEFATAGGAGLILSNGSVIVSASTIQGGPGGNGGIQGGLGGTGLGNVAATILVTGGAALRGGPSGLPTSPGFPTGNAVLLNSFSPGVLRIGSDCALVGPAPGITPVAPMAHVSDGGQVLPGGQTQVTVSALQDTVVPLLADVSLTHLQVPGLDGALLVPPTSALFLGAVLVPGGGAVPIPFAVPNDPVLRGVDVFLQGLGAEAARPLYFTDLGGFRIR